METPTSHPIKIEPNAPKRCKRKITEVINDLAEKLEEKTLGDTPNTSTPSTPRMKKRKVRKQLF